MKYPKFLKGRMAAVGSVALGFVLLVSIIAKKQPSSNENLPVPSEEPSVLQEVRQLRSDINARDQQLSNYESQIHNYANEQQRLSSNVHALADHVWLQTAVNQENTYRQRNGEPPIVLDKYWQPNRPFKYLDMNQYQSRLDRIKSRVHANNGGI